MLPFLLFWMMYSLKWMYHYNVNQRYLTANLNIFYVLGGNFIRTHLYDFVRFVKTPVT